jgi:hypothetical protein|tara:strand:+ start:700 stop:1080 length:381 start_codon:yes stop_codon:yes gene_type:complete
MDLKDWLKSINETKDNLIDEDPLLESKYLPYIVNRCMSGHIDALMYANEMNINSHLDKKLQYDFFLNSLRSKKRFSPWMRKEELSNLQTVKKYYGYSDEKARQVLPLLSDEQLDIIRQRFDTGGLK